MAGNVISSNSRTESSSKPSSPRRSLQQAQEAVYEFLLDIVKRQSSEEVLTEFRHLFVHHVDSTGAGAYSALCEIIFTNNEKEFRHTLKRCCYILVNNWGTKRNYKAIHDLLQLFTSGTTKRYTLSPTLKRLRTWIDNFVGSDDFQELKLFASRYEEHEQAKTSWKQRYTAFLLVPQYADSKNPIEQREAAKALSRRLKDRFKFDLAMYVTRSESASAKLLSLKNPTALGDEVLRLIRTIVTRRGAYSHSSLAKIFLTQTDEISYREFKLGLLEYLTFSLNNPNFIKLMKRKLAKKLEELYKDHDEEVLTNDLLLRTCNRVVDFLTIENQREPASLFVSLLSENSPITLVVVLLKIVLISRPTRTYLEAKIAKLIQYYENMPEEECDWIIHFLEVFSVTFAIHAENVEYNLVEMSKAGSLGAAKSVLDADNYRIFSSLRTRKSESSMLETLEPEDKIP